jgi:hypothetical protein
VLTAVMVIGIKVGLEFFRTPWPQPRSRLAVAYGASVLLPVGAGALALFDQLARLPDFFPFDTSQGTEGSWWVYLAQLHLRWLALDLAPLLLWFALGLNLKRHGRPTPRIFGQAARAVAEHVRAFAPLLLVVFTYSVIGALAKRPFVPDQDDLMKAVDRLLFWGRDPVQELQKVMSAPLSEWMALSYTFYVLMLPLTFLAVLWRGPLSGVDEPAFALSLALAAGYGLYLIVPVQGPMFTETFSVSLDNYLLISAKELLMDRYRVPRDCFPSLHTAVTLLCLWQIHRHWRGLALALLPVAGPIPFACVYMRYHYVADVLAGVALVALVAAITVWLRRRGSFGAPAAERPAPGA